MRVLIADDERPARERLRQVLQRHADIETIIEARDGSEVLAQLAQAPVDLLFLDIQMPELDGFEVARQLTQSAQSAQSAHSPQSAQSTQSVPMIVFVTAFDQYAVQAFDQNAIDYLLKPYDAERVARALARCREQLALRTAAATLARDASRQDRLRDAAQVDVRGEPGYPDTLLVRDRGRVMVLAVADLLWLESADNYVEVHTAQCAPLLRQTLASLIEHLGPRFERIHRRVAVQVSKVTQLVNLSKGDAEVVLSNGQRLPCSRQYRAQLLARLDVGVTVSDS